jgi:hypothetical protein
MKQKGMIGSYKSTKIPPDFISYIENGFRPSKTRKTEDYKIPTLLDFEEGKITEREKESLIQLHKDIKKHDRIQSVKEVQKFFFIFSVISNNLILFTFYISYVPLEDVTWSVEMT